MINLQKSLLDPKFLCDFQDNTDSYYLMNSLLNFDESTRKESENLKERDSIDWLDLVDFKEEQSFDEDRHNPEKDTERKKKHNKSKNSWHLIIIVF